MYHYQLKKGWCGDPNGLVFREGKYHMFYQHVQHVNVASSETSWGHATSTDLYHWKTLPVALKPNGLGAVWSGSAVIDTTNTSGLGAGTMVCIYTSAGGETYESSGKTFTQSLAYSSDGFTFINLEKNPIIDTIVTGNRDPKIFWDNGRWVMVLSLLEELIVLKSENLLDWKEICKIKPEHDDFIDCPDMFKIDDKYVLTWAGGFYTVGVFEGETFRQISDVKKYAYGDVYSSQTWNGTDQHIAIFRLGDMEDYKKTNQMSIPMVMDLVDDELHLRSYTTESLQWIKEDLPDCVESPVFKLIIEVQDNSTIKIINETIKVFSDKTVCNLCTIPHQINIIEIYSDRDSFEMILNHRYYYGSHQYGYSADTLVLDHCNSVEYYTLKDHA